MVIIDFPGGLVLKNQPTDAGHTGSIPGLGRSPREGNGNPLQCSCLGNPMDRGIWWSTVHGGGKRVRHVLVTKQQQRSSCPFVNCFEFVFVSVVSSLPLCSWLADLILVLRLIPFSFLCVSVVIFPACGYYEIFI